MFGLDIQCLRELEIFISATLSFSTLSLHFRDTYMRFERFIKHGHFLDFYEQMEICLYTQKNVL